MTRRISYQELQQNQKDEYVLTIIENNEYSMSLM